MKLRVSENLYSHIFYSLKRKLYSFFWDDICGADLANTKLKSKYNKGNRFLLCAIDNFSKNSWVIPLVDKKGITITKAFQNILVDSGRKPNKMWVNKSSEFYNILMKWLVRDNYIEIFTNDTILN